jgi:choice-of-anchor A domain-containing protein
MRKQLAIVFSMTLVPLIVGCQIGGQTSAGTQPSSSHQPLARPMTAATPPPSGAKCGVESNLEDRIFGLGDAAERNFAVLGLGSPTNISITGPSSVTIRSGTTTLANVGVSDASKFSMSDGTIDGEVILSTSATTNVSGPSDIKGGLITDDSLVTSAVSCAKARSTYYAGLAASPSTPTSINITNPSGNVTIDGTSGTNVINLTGLVLNGGTTLTLVAKDDSKIFVINDTGPFTLTGGSHIVAQNFPDNDFDVLYNVVGSGQDVQLNGGTSNGMPNSTIEGVLLAPDRNIDLSPGFVAGEVIGGGQQITITSGGVVQHYD